MKRLFVLAAGLWVARWVVLELASLLERRRPRGPAPKDLPSVPGRMPGPFD